MPSKTPTADLSEFFRYAQPKRPPCKVGFILEQLEAAERKQLEAACAQDKGIINSGAIRRWLGARNFEVSVSAITTHRAGTCTCTEVAS